MATEPRGCPFCLSHDVGLLANFHDTLTAYRCDACGQVFYTVELRCAAPPVIGPIRRDGPDRVWARQASVSDRFPPLTFLAGRLSFGRRLRRP